VRARAALGSAVANRADYGGNPALKLPALETDDGTWLGALNVCREASRRAGREAEIVWPGKRRS